MAPREFAETLLCQFPALYASLLRWKPDSSLEKRVYLEMIRPGDVVVEGGANRGYFTRLFCRLVGSRGQVHAFEPVPPTFASLRRQLDRYQFRQLFLNQAGLSDVPGRVTFSMPGNDDGQASMRHHADGSWKDQNRITSFDCEVTTLDAYAEQRQLRRVDFLKLDVEGAELLALRGGRALIARFKPPLFLEISSQWLPDFGISASEITDELLHLGYRRFWVEHGGSMVQRTGVRPGEPLPTPGSASVNVVAIAGDQTPVRPLFASRGRTHH